MPWCIHETLSPFSSFFCYEVTSHKTICNNFTSFYCRNRFFSHWPIKHGPTRTFFCLKFQLMKITVQDNIKGHTTSFLHCQKTLSPFSHNLQKFNKSGNKYLCCQFILHEHFTYLIILLYVCMFCVHISLYHIIFLN